jgi:hypothetical protein
MKKILLILCLFPILVFSQKSYKIPADSTILNNIGSGKNELVIRNATSNITGGVLTNLGNGVTAFVLGGGSARVVDTIYKNNTKDSIVFTISGIRYAVKDSIGVTDLSGYALQSSLNDTASTLRRIRKVDSSYLFRNSSLDSICQVTIINGLSYRSCAKDSLPTVSSTSTTTFTNKRITARVDSTTSSATPTINTDNIDTYKLTAQAVDITSFTTNLSGTPTDDQILHIIIKGTGARTISWGSSFEASTVALPTTTVSTDRLDVYFVWNTFTSKWRCGGVW